VLAREHAETECPASLTEFKNRVHVIPMPRPHRLLAAGSLRLLPLLACAACATPPSSDLAMQPHAVALLESASAEYAALQLKADSLTTSDAQETGEAAQSAARSIADGIAPLRGEFEDVTVGMSTAELEQTRSLWMRLALSHAALEQLYRSALTLSADPAATPDEVRDLAEQLAGALELARASSRMAADRLQTPIPPPAPPPGITTVRS
jgi:hypothetical protein